MTATTSERRLRQQYHKRWHSHPSGLKIDRLTVPENIERREESSPCFNCGERGGCRHRPWMLANG